MSKGPSPWAWAWWGWGLLSLLWSLAPGHTWVASLWEVWLLLALAAGRWRVGVLALLSLLLLDGLYTALALWQAGLVSYVSGSHHYLLEALALGVPVVAAPLPGLGDWLREKGLAQVALSREPEALAKAMAGLLESPALANTLRQRGREWVEEKGLEGMVEKILALYQELAHPAKVGQSP